MKKFKNTREILGVQLIQMQLQKLYGPMVGGGGNYRELLSGDDIAL